jgi:hypothetical protein
MAPKKELKNSSVARSYDRSKCTLSVADCTASIKQHVQDPIVDDAWMSETPEQLIVRYASFLKDLLERTERINVYILKKAFMNQFEGTWDFADMWGSKIMIAFQASKVTGKNMVDGSRLPEAVAEVAGAWKRKLSPSPSPSPSRFERVLVKAEGLLEVKDEADAALDLWATPAPQIKQEQLPTLHPSSSSGMSELDKAMSLWGSAPVPEQVENKKEAHEVALLCMHALMC